LRQSGLAAFTPRALLNESGAEAVEFALVAPILFFLIIGLIYFLLLFSAHVSLSHAVSVGMRFAVVPTTPNVKLYPAASAVNSRVADSALFFDPEDCSSSVLGDVIQNSQVTLTVSCNFPNPAGGALDGLRSLVTSTGASSYSSNVQVAASARGRRE
jgi:Flp pilus assembly protein TadG